MIRPGAILLLGLVAVLPGATPALQADAAVGGLLPVQDRTGNRAMVDVLRESLRSTLAARHPLADPVDVRNAMRRLRVRNVRDTDPQKIRRLADELGVDWFFAPTLHRTRTRPMPTVTLSAQVFASDAREIRWAGFESATGLDHRRVLGLGVIVDLDAVARRVAVRLVEDFLQIPPTFERGGVNRERKPARGGFRRHSLDPETLGRVAVVPFDSVTDTNPVVNAELMTGLAWAVLHRAGVELVWPALVNETLRRRGVLYLGELDRLARAALGIACGAESIITGTVETYDTGGGFEPEPWVAFSARLIDVDTGSIDWIHGLEELGWDREAAFLTGRIYGAGRLAEEMMHSLIAGLLDPRPRKPTTKGWTS